MLNGENILFHQGHVDIIAEAGVNHNGELSLAFELIDIAQEAGADFIKFQTFKTDKLTTENAKKADYQVSNTKNNSSQYEMLKKLELSEQNFFDLKEYAKKKNIKLLSTAFDEDSLEFLVNKLELNTLKIASGELTNAPFILSHAKKKKKLIVSTGMSGLKEIEEALGVIAFGLLGLNETPNEQAFKYAYISEEGQQLLKKHVTLLHCTSEYPAPFQDINLNAIKTLRNTFGLPVGYSDHTSGIAISTAAVACGATVIEKHITLDKTMEGPDHAASLEPQELKDLVEAARAVEIAMGDGIKIPRPSEIKNQAICQKSIVAEKTIQIGEKFTNDNIAIKRPGDGMKPSSYWQVLGAASKKEYKAGDLINE